MASDRRAPRTRTLGDGVRVTRTRRPSTFVWGVVVLAVGLGLVARFVGRATPAPSASSGPARTGATPAPHPVADPPAAATAAPRDPELADQIRQRRAERRDDRRAKSESPYTLNAPGENAGMAAFPPPGSKPIKRGIVVPDDFELPEGYVRHYQTTDDGRRLPPILMFHPDFAGRDANGNPAVAPEDRIVPPELAPPGLPHRILDETADVDEHSVGRRVHSDTSATGGR